MRAGSDLNDKPIRKFHCPLAYYNETVKLEQTSAWPDAKACTRAEPLARYKTKVLWHFRFLRPAKVTLGNQLGRRDLGPPVVKSK